MSSQSLPYTYELRRDAPPPMSWETYCDRVLREWSDLLNRAGEPELQDFLERHPCMLPAPKDLLRGGHHDPHWGAAISQPPLPGFDTRTPDFMWIGRDSACVTALLIEIESPAKQWWRTKGRQTADLTQARGQLEQWQAWFDSPRNTLEFRSTYEIPDVLFTSGALEQHYALVYGRRAEATQVPAWNQRRAKMRKPNESFMTWDRLSPARYLDYPTVRIHTRDGKKTIDVLHVPATFRLGPARACYLHRFSGLADAIRRNDWISSERQDFLCGRIGYWADWWNQERQGPYRVGDFE